MPQPAGSSPDACPACGGPLSPWRRVPASDPVLGDAAYDLWRCRRCGTAVTLGRAPEALHDSGAYGGGAPRLSGFAAPLLRRFDRRRLTLLAEAAPPPARLLDVGAGRGRFVLGARRLGYEASGLEPSQRGLEAARAAGAPVQPGSVEEAQVRPGSLDAVTLWHVLEHLDDPAAALRSIHGWLRADGALLVGVPNMDSLQARLSGDRWYHLDVPRHRVHFTVTGLHALLAREGYRVLHTEHLLAEHNPFGMWQSLLSRVTRTPSYLYHLLKHNAPLRSTDLVLTVVALPLAPLAALLEAFAARRHRGGTVAVLARAVAGEE